jgi:phosphonopyruvate decarboxylase
MFKKLNSNLINVKEFQKVLKNNNCNFFTGVPDSVLKEFSKSLEGKKNHIIATNEGSAVSLGIGNYLSTNRIPCIYMQNSGLSNALNPLISIAHKKVYSIPLILVIGWRGSPNKKDEPQHEAKGKITPNILKLLNIDYIILRNKKDLTKFDKKIKLAIKKKTIVACLIEENTFKKITSKKIKEYTYNFNKEIFLKDLLSILPTNTRVISSTGYNSREIMYLKEKYKTIKTKNFYMVGGMGHTMSVALGYSLSSNNKTICIDGDGSLLMHLGGITTLAKFSKNNLKYILLNNNAHDSVGGQLTHSDSIDFKNFSKSLGFKKFALIKNKFNLKNKLRNFIFDKKLSFMEVKVSGSKIKNLPRPDDLIKIKNKFMY